MTLTILATGQPMGEFIVHVILQTGSLGLLAIGLWFAPKWVDKILSRWEDERKSHMGGAERLRADFREEMKAEREMCNRQFEKICSLMVQHRDESHISRKEAIQEIVTEVQRILAGQKRG